MQNTKINEEKDVFLKRPNNDTKCGSWDYALLVAISLARIGGVSSNFIGEKTTVIMCWFSQQRKLSVEIKKLEISLLGGSKLKP